ncbi:MAG: aminopeptidase [Methanobacteriota archaeon]|nr:MAG: aminopeptidase [Euryarchaeota archaeon]
MSEIPGFGGGKAYSRSLVRGARAAIRDVLSVRKGERILIVSNPNPGTRDIAMALFDAALRSKASPVLAFQGEKGQFDYTEEEIIKALAAEPEIVLSISKDRMGLDRYGLKHGYKGKRRYDSLFDMLYCEGRMRAFWSPGITTDTFARTVAIDYTVLRKDCKRLVKEMAKAEAIRVTSPSGTDVVVGVKGRTPKSDDGDFRKPGLAGNIPSGEVYVSPKIGGVNGSIAFDGSIALNDGEVVIRKPIVVEVEKGYVKSISGGSEAELLRRSIRLGESNADRMGKKGELKSSEARRYRRNARAIGELGIGLNRKARIVANMLEDEKVYGTCHFAVGSNYDGDADALIHLDGLVKTPTVSVSSKRPCNEKQLMVDGRLVWD